MGLLWDRAVPTEFSSSWQSVADKHSCMYINLIAGTLLKCSGTYTWDRTSLLFI